MKFDISKYETVKQRKKRFYNENPDGRIIVTNVSDNIMEAATMKVTIYKNREDQEKGLPWSTGYGHEIRDKELKVSKKGDKYESVNYTSWTENCEESAVGRALDNAGYASNDKCSREEIEKVHRAVEINKTQKQAKHKEAKNRIERMLAEKYKEIGVFTFDEISKYKEEIEKIKKTDDLITFGISIQKLANTRKKKIDEENKGSK